MVSIDEVSRLHGLGTLAAIRCRSPIGCRVVEQQSGLSVSIGISRTKLVFQVASDLAKPRGILGSCLVTRLRCWRPLKSEIAGHRQGYRESDFTMTNRKVLALPLGRQTLNELFGQWGISPSQGSGFEHRSF
jgi:hypothetical protein